MMRSLFSGVSGLQNHQTRMDVIGNNISNVNTTGFKRGRVNFQDLISQTTQGPARPNDRIGGINPKQVGLGMQIATIDTIHTQGSLQQTNVRSDLAILGAGFFVLRSGDEDFYTRAGAFGVDEAGMLVNPANGFRVQGWNAQNVDGQALLNTSSALEDLVIPIGTKDPAQETTQVFLASNLNKTTPVIPAAATDSEIAAGTWTVEYDIFDAAGTNHTLRIDFVREPGAENLWRATLQINPEDPDAATNPVINIGGVDNLPGDTTFLVEFDNAGRLLSLQNDAGGIDNVEELALDVTFDVPDSSIPIDPATGLPGGIQQQTFAITLGQVGSTTNSTTQFSEQSSTRVFSQDGYGMGYMQEYSVDRNGIITGVFSNGQTRTLGQVALATFTNPGGLEKTGDTNFRQTINSGLADIGTVGVAGRGVIASGALEMSNVDLADQFTDMIVTQRGFQANSRTIQTSDQMLQELLTLKR